MAKEYFGDFPIGHKTTNEISKLRKFWMKIQKIVVFLIKCAQGVTHHASKTKKKFESFI